MYIQQTVSKRRLQGLPVFSDDSVHEMILGKFTTMSALYASFAARGQEGSRARRLTVVNIAVKEVKSSDGSVVRSRHMQLLYVNRLIGGQVSGNWLPNLILTTPGRLGKPFRWAAYIAELRNKPNSNPSPSKKHLLRERQFQHDGQSPA